MRFLEDDILRLRAVEPSDADMMWSVETDSSQWLDNGMSAPYSRHNLREYADNYDADPIRAGQLRLVAELKESDRYSVVGLVDLYDISSICRTAFIGIYICEPYRGNGHASRALSLMEKYARRLLNLRILAAKVSASNTASIHMFSKSGYMPAGELRDWILNGAETFSLLIYTKSLVNS